MSTDSCLISETDDRKEKSNNYAFYGVAAAMLVGLGFIMSRKKD